MKTWLKTFLPVPMQTTLAERVRATLGTLIGLIITGAVATAAMHATGTLPLLIAPIGASAVLLFGVPASPLAQPWSILGGNLVSALIGVAAAQAIAAPLPAVAVAVGASFAAMSLLRCVHPPSGAVAAMAVLGGPQVLAAGYGFVAMPVLLNSGLLVLAALLYNNATGLSYPHHAHAPLHPHPPARPVVLTDEDFDAVLADYGEALDIRRDDLKQLYVELIGRAEERRRPI
jgi:CBS domain-containing membrane protein